MRCSSWLDMSLKTAPNCENSSVAAHGQALVEAPGGDGADAVGERAQRVRERAHGERGAGADQQQQQAHEQRDALADRARVGVELVLRVERDGVGGDLLRRIADPAGCRAIARALDVEPERPAEGQRRRGQRHLLVAQLQLVPGCEAEHDVVVRLLDLRDQLARDPPTPRRVAICRMRPDRPRLPIACRSVGRRGCQVLPRRVLHGDAQTAA